MSKTSWGYMGLLFMALMICGCADLKSTASDSDEAKLQSLARQHFDNPLTDAEKYLLHRNVHGQPADFSPDKDEFTEGTNDCNPAHAELWSTNRVIRAGLLEWLCKDIEAKKLLPAAGVQIACAKIEGKLNLYRAELAFPLVAHQCFFTDDINFENSHLKELDLTGSWIQNLYADKLDVDGDVLLYEKFKANGIISLPGAIIGRDLVCEGGYFSNPSGVAIDAKGINIGGFFYLGCCDTNLFSQTEGAVTIYGATIKHDLNCAGSHFLNPNGMAIDATEASIAGSVNLNNNGTNSSFQADGEVSFSGAAIDHDLNCTGGHFSNPGGLAIDATEASIAGLVNLNNDGTNSSFQADGEVSFRGAAINHNLDCEGGYFCNTNAPDCALVGSGANIKGYVLLRKKFCALGEVNLLGAIIGGDLDCEDGHFTCISNRPAVNAERTKIGGNVFLRGNFGSLGEVRFIGASIGGDLDCDDGCFTNCAPDMGALNANRTKIDGNVYFRGTGTVSGMADFENSHIAQQFVWLVHSPEKAILDLSSAKVGKYVDTSASWPKAGNLFLNGFIYDEIEDDDSDLDDVVPNRIEWLHRQPVDLYFPRPYEQLATVLRNGGLEDASRKILIEKNRALSHLIKKSSPSWWWYNVFGRFIDYGYNVSGAVWATIGFVLLGWMVFAFGFTKNCQKFDGWGLCMLVEFVSGSDYVEGNSLFAPEDEKKKDIRFNGLLYSLESFVPFLKFKMVDAWRPDANRGRPLLSRERFFLTTGGLLRFYFWLHIILGWIFTSLWVGALVGLLKN